MWRSFFRGGLQAVLSINAFVYEGCNGLRRAVLVVNAVMYEDKKAAQRERLTHVSGVRAYPS